MMIIRDGDKYLHNSILPITLFINSNKNSKKGTIQQWSVVSYVIINYSIDAK